MPFPFSETPDVCPPCAPTFPPVRYERGPIPTRCRNSVYVVTNRVNKKQYIGKTIRSLRARWRSHCGNNSGCWALKGAITKYGEDAFKIDLLVDGLDDNDAERTEAEMIEKYKTMAPHGYNLTKGGQGSAHKNPHHGEHIALAWKRSDTRDRHMSWRTTERMSEKNNKPSSLDAQQHAWFDKRFKKALDMPLEDAILMISYSTTKNLEHGRRRKWSDERMKMTSECRTIQISKLCQMRGVPVPPASTYEMTYARKKQYAERMGWKS